jgi:hypothetical protein
MTGENEEYKKIFENVFGLGFQSKKNYVRLSGWRNGTIFVADSMEKLIEDLNSFKSKLLVMNRYGCAVFLPKFFTLAELKLKILLTGINPDEPNFGNEGRPDEENPFFEYRIRKVDPKELDIRSTIVGVSIKGNN